MRQDMFTLSETSSTTSHFDNNILSIFNYLGSPFTYCTQIFNLMRNKDSSKAQSVVNRQNLYDTSSCPETGVEDDFTNVGRKRRARKSQSPSPPLSIDNRFESLEREMDSGSEMDSDSETDSLESDAIHNHSNMSMVEVSMPESPVVPDIPATPSDLPDTLERGALVIDETSQDSLTF